MGKVWSENDLNYLVKNYNNFSIEDIAERLNRSFNSIYSKASRMKLSRKKYNQIYMSEKKRIYGIKGDSFYDIATEKQAYFLGLLFADGYNYEKKHNISLALHERDLDILEKFNTFTQNERPIYRRIDSRKGRNSVICTASFASQSISNDLARHGCGQNKTFSISIPHLFKKDNDLLRHFVRGYFDGDGSLIVTTKKINKNNKTYVGTVVRIGITSNHSFAIELFNSLPIEITIKGVYVFPDKRHDNVSNLNITSTKRVLDFLEWIYYNSSVHLNRKHSMFLRLKNGISDGLKGQSLVDKVKIER